MSNLQRVSLLILFSIFSLSIVSCNKVELENEKPSTTLEQIETEWIDGQRGIEELDDVWIETEYETYKSGTINVKVKWFNTLSDKLTYGASFILEKEVKDKWKQVSKETSINFAFISIGYILEPNASRWHNYHLICYSDGLTPGNYRINATFSRNTFDGVAYGSGNYPKYQVYGYFTVADKIKERELTNLYESTIEYKNEQYGFAVYLPPDWDGFLVIEEHQNKESELHELFSELDEDYFIVRVRHPKWTKETPYQDIVFSMIQREEWNQNANSATNGNFGKLPKVVLSSSKYLLVIDPDDYNENLREYQNVLDILVESFQAY